VWLARVTGVDVEQTWIGRFGNFGTLIIGDFSGAQEVLQNIEDPQAFRRLVEQQLAGPEGVAGGGL
jgi:hypothetical protein